MRRWSLLGLSLVFATHGAVMAAPPASQLPPQGRIIIDGSSTVWPITADAAERFAATGPETRFDLEISGTSGGFRRFCAGASDIQNASRPISDKEREACAENGVRWREFVIGLDGVTLVVSPENTFAACLTTAQLRAIWEPASSVKTWQDLDPAWPAEELALYGPGPDSGTFDFFTEAVVGEAGASRTDYIPSENDLYLVEEVAANPNALAYVGFAYAEQADDRLTEVAVDGGAGCVQPGPESIISGEYDPLSRPLFVYVNEESLQREEVDSFMRAFLTDASEIVSDVGYVPLTDSQYAANLDELGKTGATPTPGQ
jgi:phosphate transport system substrate-binding protein